MLLRIRRWLRKHKKISRGGTAIVIIAGIWGLFNNTPIIPFLYQSVTQPTQDIYQIVTRLAGIAFIVGGAFLLYYINKLPDDIRASEIAKNATIMKTAIIDRNQLYGSFISDLIGWKVKDYIPLIKDDILFQRDARASRDKEVAARSYIAHSMQNPAIENLKKESPEWKTLEDKIDRAAISIADKKLNSYLRIYRENLESNGIWELRGKLILGEIPITTYAHRTLGILRNKFSRVDVENSLLDLITYLDDLIWEYGEETKEECILQKSNKEK